MVALQHRAPLRTKRLTAAMNISHMNWLILELTSYPAYRRNLGAGSAPRGESAKIVDAEQQALIHDSAQRYHFPSP